jgi:hypothetical protein
MKNLLLLLLLANILYFLWGLYAPVEPTPGVAIVRESDLGPPLTLAPRPDVDQLAAAATVLSPDTQSTLAATVGRSCVTIGPFNEAGDAEEARSRNSSAQMRSAIRSEPGQIFLGHWVQIRNIPSREESNRIVQALKMGGIKDAYPVETEDEGLKISLGLFGKIESAERVELQARSLGFAPDISPRLRDGEVYFVDIGLPPGKGAGEIIERYGAEHVQLRDQATCPPD